MLELHDTQRDGAQKRQTLGVRVLVVPSAVGRDPA